MDKHRKRFLRAGRGASAIFIKQHAEYSLAGLERV
jgi:hypothetical protein